MDLIVATTNAGKAKEFREMLGEGRFRWFDPAVAGIPEVEETGRSFRENSCLKAAAYAKHSGKWALADDSGLEVASLGGKPGIHSARWAAIHDAGNGDAANNALLLRQLEGVTDRSARFVCLLALSNPAGHIVMTTFGFVNGVILQTPLGDNGFGYDPLFMVESLQQTTAEMSADQKHAISHRGVALRRMRDLLSRSDLTFE